MRGSVSLAIVTNRSSSSSRGNRGRRRPVQQQPERRGVPALDDRCFIHSEAGDLSISTIARYGYISKSLREKHGGYGFARRNFGIRGAP